MEVATIGHTILISRGLLDALPNEAALAVILAHALAHATLGHDLDSSFAFNDRMVVPSLQQLPLFDFKHTPEQEREANALGLKILANSPYKDSLGEAGLFLKALAKYSKKLPNLSRANLGESLLTDNRVSFESHRGCRTCAGTRESAADRCTAIGQPRETRSLGGPTEVRESPAASHLLGQR
jgi:hypothetical protein